MQPQCPLPLFPTCLELCVCERVCVAPFCILCACMFRNLHTSVNAGTENNPKEQADPNPIPRMNMYHSENPDPYLHAVNLNSAVTVPTFFFFFSFSTARTKPCMYKHTNLLQFNSSSTSENLFETFFFFILASVEKPFQVMFLFFCLSFSFLEDCALTAFRGK